MAPERVSLPGRWLFIASGSERLQGTLHVYVRLGSGPRLWLLPDDGPPREVFNILDLRKID